MAKAYTPQEAAQLGLGWVPENHPLYGTPGYVGSEAPKPQTPAGTLPDPVPGYTQPTPPTGAPNGPEDQGKNAQTYTDTPGAAPTGTTTNAGTQDVVRNSYLQRATQPVGVERNSAEFRAQVDPYAAAQERTRRRAENEAAERASAQGLGTSGAMDLERRAAQERAGQATGLFESELVGRELQRQYDDKKEALNALRGMISDDQTRQLQKELADLDAAIKRESLAQTGSLGGRELDLKRDLGFGGLNVDLIRALLSNQQFLTDAGIRIGDLEGRYSPWLF